MLHSTPDSAHTTSYTTVENNLTAWNGSGGIPWVDTSMILPDILVDKNDIEALLSISQIYKSSVCLNISSIFTSTSNAALMPFECGESHSVVLVNTLFIKWISKLFHEDAEKCASDVLYTHTLQNSVSVSRGASSMSDDTNQVDKSNKSKSNKKYGDIEEEDEDEDGRGSSRKRNNKISSSNKGIYNTWTCQTC